MRDKTDFEFLQPMSALAFKNEPEVEDVALASPEQGSALRVLIS